MMSADTRYFYGLIVFCVVLVTFAAAIASGADMDWGDVPTWGAGLVAVAALYAAWRAGTTARELLQVERDREDRAEQRDAALRDAEARAAQADRVAAWNAPEYLEGRTDGLVVGGKVIVQNDNPLPIWDVAVTIYAPDGSERQRIEPGFVEPHGRSFKWPNELRARDDSKPGVLRYTERVSEFSASVEFRDAAGRVWLRDRFGILNQTGLMVFGESSLVAQVSAVAEADVTATGPDGADRPAT